MSWLARSFANSLRSDLRHGGGSGSGVDDDGGDANEGGAVKTGEDGKGEQDLPIDPESGGRGVKEDLSELTKTLSRQFWGVANFLAPPPPIPSSTSDGDRQSDPAASEGVDQSEFAESQAITGIRSDFAEIGGRFRSGISRLSGHKAVSEISKIASTFLPFGSEEDEEQIEESEGRLGRDAVGVTEVVLAFARNISMHPETWLDFPLLADDEDSDGLSSSLVPFSTDRVKLI